MEKGCKENTIIPGKRLALSLSDPVSSHHAPGTTAGKSIILFLHLTLSTQVPNIQRQPQPHPGSNLLTGNKSLISNRSAEQITEQLSKLLSSINMKCLGRNTHFHIPTFVKQLITTDGIQRCAITNIRSAQAFRLARQNDSSLRTLSQL